MKLKSAEMFTGHRWAMFAGRDGRQLLRSEGSAAWIRVVYRSTAMLRPPVIDGESYSKNQGLESSCRRGCDAIRTVGIGTKSGR